MTTTVSGYTAQAPLGGHKLARRATLTRRPSLPTSVLPKIPRSLVGAGIPTQDLLNLVAHLRTLYAENDAAAAAAQSAAAQGDDSALAENDDDDDDDEDVADPLGADSQFERGWTKSWLVSLLRKGEEWVNEVQDDDERERNLRMQVIDDAGALVASLTETSVSGSILRPLLLPTSSAESEVQTEPLMITLNDALPSSLDPTSVGLQSWGSSIILSRLIALRPREFGVGIKGARTLELGAGTGLLSLVWKGMDERLGGEGGDVIATDFHDEVLNNLRLNVKSNTPAITPSATVSPETSAPSSPSFFPADAVSRVLREKKGQPPKAMSNGASPANSAGPSPAAPVPATPGSGAGTPVFLPSSAHPSRQSSPTLGAPPAIAAHKLDWSAVHSSRKFATAMPMSGGLTMPPPFDKPFHTIIAADVVYGPDHAIWLKSCVEQFLQKPDGTCGSRPTSPRTVVRPEPLHLPSMDVLDLNDSLTPPTGDKPLVASASREPSPLTTPKAEEMPPPPVPTTSRQQQPAREAEPAFHLIVPLRPTHTAALDSISAAFPSLEQLGQRRADEPWRVGVKKITELDRTKGIGRSDEGGYRLYEIGWC